MLVAFLKIALWPAGGREGGVIACSMHISFATTTLRYRDGFEEAEKFNGLAWYGGDGIRCIEVQHLGAYADQLESSQLRWVLHYSIDTSA